MPEENLNEPNNQPQGQPDPESQDQPRQEPQTEELSEFDRVLADLPEDRRKIVEEASMRKKDYTQKTQSFSEERKRSEQLRSENQTKIDFYNKFRDDDSFRQEVLSSMGAPKKVIKSDNFDEQYAQAQELINNLDPDSRKAMNFLIKKQIRDEVGPVRTKMEEFERQQTESQQRKFQQANFERQQVLVKFKQDHPDYVDVEPKMEKMIKRFPGFFNQSPQDLVEALEEVYQVANLPNYKQKAEEKGIKKMLDQNVRAQSAASKASPRPAPAKVYGNKKRGMTLKECANETWDEMNMGG